MLNIQWLLNGRSSGGLHLNPNVYKEQNQIYIKNLTVSLNGTTIQCKIIRDQRTVTYGETILIVEG